MLPGAAAAVARLNQAGRLVVVCTNQGVVGRGIIDEAMLAHIHDKLRERARPRRRPARRADPLPRPSPAAGTAAQARAGHAARSHDPVPGIAVGERHDRGWPDRSRGRACRRLRARAGAQRQGPRAPRRRACHARCCPSRSTRIWRAGWQRISMRPRKKAAPGQPIMRRLFGFLLLLAFLWFAGLVVFVSGLPGHPQEADRHTDAIVVVTGGSERLAEGIRLLNHGLADKLFISGVNAGTHMPDIIASLAAPGGEAFGQAAGLLHPRRLCRRQHAGQCGGDRGLDAGGGASFPAAGDRRLPHAAQPAGIPQRHAEDRDHRQSRLSRSGAPRILVAFARHGEPPHQRIRQISGGPAAHRDPSAAATPESSESKS